MSDSINLLSSTPRFPPAQCYRILTAFLLLGRIIGGIAVITGTQQPVSPISPSSQDEKQRDGDEFSNNLVSDLSP